MNTSNLRESGLSYAEIAEIGELAIEERWSMWHQELKRIPKKEYEKLTSGEIHIAQKKFFAIKTPLLKIGRLNLIIEKINNYDKMLKKELGLKVKK